jgi:Flp pilus assembly CpaE family ATPase
VLREADQIFLVTTPELPAVRLARLKVALFRRLNLDDAVHLVVNRLRRGVDLDVPQIEEAVGLPVYATFPCDYENVTTAIRKGQSASHLSESVDTFVEKILDKKPPQEKPARFIKRLGLAPVRYAFR